MWYLVGERIPPPRFSFYVKITFASVIINKIEDPKDSDFKIQMTLFIILFAAFSIFFPHLMQSTALYLIIWNIMYMASVLSEAELAPSKKLNRNLNIFVHFHHTVWQSHGFSSLQSYCHDFKYSFFYAWLKWVLNSEEKKSEEFPGFLLKINCNWIIMCFMLKEAERPTCKEFWSANFIHQ